MAGHVSSIILKVVGTCNLNCEYCYIYNHEDSSYLRRAKLMTDEVFEATLRAVADYCGRRQSVMSIVFHGGEPMLVGRRRFRKMVRRAREVLGESLEGLIVQTNGTLLDERWVELLWQEELRVSVSLDGPEEVHDRTRVDHGGRGTQAQTVRGIELLQRGGVDPNVLCVVTPGACGVGTYSYLRGLGIRRMDFLLPDVSHDRKAAWYGAYGPQPVSDFLIPAFDTWFDEDSPEVSVRLFWSLLRVLLGGRGSSDAFGNPLMGYLIVETDGEIQALDALRVCREGIAESGLNVLSHGFDDLAEGKPLIYQCVHEGFRLCETCRRCHEREVCGGGYLPHRYSAAREFDNPSVWCADILALLAHMRSRLKEYGYELAA